VEKGMIEFHAVTKRYGHVLAVDGFTMSVGHGEYCALLGPNGAGKTTLVKMLLDFTRPTSGAVSVDGVASTDTACRASVGCLAENHRMPPQLTGWQYLRRCAELQGLRGDAPDRCRRIVEIIGMRGKEHDRAATYSKGMLQRFGLGAALVGDPHLLILDEPTAGLDPIGIRETRQLLETLKKQGITLLLSSHLLSEVEKICDTAAILREGRLLVKDEIAAIVKDGETLEDVFVRFVKT
jgi:ABC-2 type transport system ATP-binding protein